MLRALAFPLVWLFTIGAAAGAEVSISTLDGKSTEAKLVGVAGQELVLEDASGKKSIPFAELLSVSMRQSPAAAPQPAAARVELVDDSAFAVTSFETKKGTARLTFPGGHELEVPVKSIRSVRFRDPAGDDPWKAQWATIVTAPATGDVLVIRKKDSLDFLAGVVNDVEAEKSIHFELNHEPLPVNRSKVEGILYYHAQDGATPAQPVCEIVRGDGSRLRVAKMALEGETLEVATPAGLSLKQPLAGVSRIDFSSVNTKYLSDLEESSVEAEGFFGPVEKLDSLQKFLAPRKDAGFGERPLATGGVAFRKGLALRSRTLVNYAVPTGFAGGRLRGVAGLADGATGALRLEIKADAKSLLKVDLRSGDTAKPIDLPLDGAKNLQILVDFGDDLHVGDELVLGELRFTK